MQAYAAAGTLNQNYANILLMLLRLRQACDHPCLVKQYDTDNIGKDSVEMAQRLPQEMLVNLLSLLEASQPICRKCEVCYLQTSYACYLHASLFHSLDMISLKLVIGYSFKNMHEFGIIV